MGNRSHDEKYILPDILQSGLITVFCGRAPSPESRRRGAYYAHPSNLFWRVLADTGMTDRRLLPEEFRELSRYGIGLTDINKFESGSDHELTGTGDKPELVAQKILKYQPRMLAFTGKNNARMFLHGVFGRQKSRWLECGRQEGYLIGDTEIFVLPSTSARARRYWDVECWQQLANKHITLKYGNS